MTIKKLTALEQAVLDNLPAAGWNHTLAYTRARPNCTYQTARTYVAQLLKRQHVRAAYKRIVRQYQTTLRDEGHRLIQTLQNIAFSDPGDVFDCTGTGHPKLKKAKYIRPEARQTIQQIEIDEEVIRSNRKGGTKPKAIGKRTKVKIKFHDKIAAARLLADILHLKEVPDDMTRYMETLLAFLPPQLAVKVRAAMFPDGMGFQGQEAGESPRVAIATSSSNAPADVPGDGGESGPVATEIHHGSSPAPDRPRVSAGGEELRGGSEDAPPLFDDP